MYSCVNKKRGIRTFQAGGKIKTKAPVFITAVQTIRMNSKGITCIDYHTDLIELSGAGPEKTENTSILLAAKERIERIEIQCLFFALLAFFCGQTAVV